MAKLYFNYSTMNAGKSTLLLQAAHNYRERGMQTTEAPNRSTVLQPGKIASRIVKIATALCSLRRPKGKGAT